MKTKRGMTFGDIVVLIIISCITASVSFFLIFMVQYQRTTLPSPETSKESFFTLQVKEQERKQQHDHFHNLTEDVNLEAWAEKSHCLICHSAYPHGESGDITTMLNLHTEFMTCSTCHLTASRRTEISYRFYNPTDFRPKSFPYGTRIDLKTGLLAETDDHYSKLAIYHFNNNQWLPVLSDQGIPSAREYMEKKDSLSEQERKEIEDTFHLDMEKQGPDCHKCHSEKSEIAYAKLGFDDARTHQLENMEISGIITGYEKIYLPDLFK